LGFISDALICLERIQSALLSYADPHSSRASTYGSRRVEAARLSVLDHSLAYADDDTKWLIKRYKLLKYWFETRMHELLVVCIMIVIKVSRRRATRWTCM
jgi:hypothetical protein